MKKTIAINAGTKPGVCAFTGKEASDIRIAAVTPFTTIDYPGLLSAVAFVQGCPWRCPYCQNDWMQPREFAEGTEPVSWDAFCALLKKRAGLLDAVVFSGGEPCIDPALPAAMAYVRNLGMKVGLHTSGAYPRRLKEVIDLVSWVGLDVKGPPEDAAVFDRAAGRPGAHQAFLESFEIVRQSGVAYEARTTAHPDLLTPEAILAIAQFLASHECKTYALQIYRKAPGMKASLSSVGADYPGDELEKTLAGLFPSFTLRRS